MPACLRVTTRAFCLAALFALVAGPRSGAEDPFEISSIAWSPQESGRVVVRFPHDRDHYYVLWHGSTPEAMNPVDLVWPNTLFARSSLTARGLRVRRDGLFRVARHPLANGWDHDGDGADDWLELRHPSLLDPLDAGDRLPLEDGAVMIRTREQFEALARRDNVPGALGVRETKYLVVDVHTDEPLLYYLNTKNHPYHTCFASQAIGRNTAGFNSVTYFLEEGRQFIAGSLIAHDNFERTDGGLGIYTMEFWPTDGVPHHYVQLVYDLLQEGFSLGRELIHYHPNGSTQEELHARERDAYEASGMPVIFSEELFGSLAYSPLNAGTSFGRLKVYSPSETYSARDIVIFRTIPNDINLTAGIITEVPQTPLSHVNLKAQQNGIPNAFIAGASTDPEIEPLIGSYVEFTVDADGYGFRPATAPEVEIYLDSIRPEVGPVPESNLLIRDIRPLDEIGFRNWTFFGVKAANVAELRDILPEGMVPDGYGVPFSFYDEFMRDNGFYDEAEAMLAEEDFQADPAVREDRLRDFRKRIRDTGEAPQWMLDELQAMHESFPEGTRLRCRSSTNNEDIEGFNGAGLYNSYTHHPDEGHIIKSMKQVWASLWTFRAFEERDFYRIDHFQVYMGVLVHPNFSDEQANGVAITRNIFDPRWDGYYVNVQLGEDLVTNPEDESIPEEFLVSRLAADNGLRYEIQYARYSNRVEAGSTVLTREQAIELATQLQRIQTHFRGRYNKFGDDDFAMDIEFKIDEDGRLIIKQARPWVWPGLPSAEDENC